MRTISLFTLLLFFACKGKIAPVENSRPLLEASISIPSTPPESILNRTEIKEQLKQKIAAGKPLIVRVFVPLCDNENQGIVPVPSSLGNGFKPGNNLYWGALYGIKTHFRKQSDWTYLPTSSWEETKVLDRVVFQKSLGNTSVYIIADAYQGDAMDVCLVDFFETLSGKRDEALQLEEGMKIDLAADADLVVFNGHNGLMDMKYSGTGTSSKGKDAAVIACVSGRYFNDKIQEHGGYPLLMTTNFMAPEAYVLEALVNSWSNLEDGEAIRKAAGQAYHKYQKCGERGALRLFQTGYE